MPAAAAEDFTPIESRAQLARLMEQGAKTKTGLLIGTEHEKFTLSARDFSPAPFDGPQGIEALLRGLMRFGFDPVMEGGRITGLWRGGEGVSLEPAGQLELSGAPLPDLHDTAAELERHFREVTEIGRALELAFLPLGYHPEAAADNMPRMPKERYAIMRAYMPRKGRRGLEMMTLTCTTQANLDYVSEADMARKMRVALSLSPVVAALFANSPFRRGKLNGMESNRYAAWEDVDPDRTGLLPLAFEPGFGFERYVDYALDAPMYFIRRGGKYVDCAGQSFRDFLAGSLPALPGEKPVMADWIDHLTTLYPDVRLKTYLEMRSADVGDPDMILALPALWVGLLYDDSTLNQMEALVKDWRPGDRTRLRAEAPKLGLAAHIGGCDLLNLGRKLVHHATLGLRRRCVRMQAGGADETRYLEPLTALLDLEETQSGALRRRFTRDWQGDLRQLYRGLVL